MLLPELAPSVPSAGIRPLPFLLQPCAQWLRRIDRVLTTPLSAQQAVLRLSLYLLLAANWPLWLQLRYLGGNTTAFAALAALVLCGMLALLSLSAWAFAARGINLLWWLVTLVAALAQYYMLTYGVVMDPGMLANVLQTDVREASDLLGMRLLLSVVAVMFLPTWWLLRLQLRLTFLQGKQHLFVGRAHRRARQRAGGNAAVRIPAAIERLLRDDRGTHRRAGRFGVDEDDFHGCGDGRGRGRHAPRPVQD